MADAYTTTPELAASQMEFIDSSLQSFLIEESMFLGKVNNISNLAVKGVKSIDLPLMDSFVVGDKTIKTKVDAQDLTASADRLELNKHKVIQFLLEDIGDVQSRLNVMTAAIERASKELALQVDKDIIAELELAAAGQGFALAAATMGRTDVLEARKILRKNFLRPSELFMAVNPDREKELLDIDEFIFANEYGKNPAGIETGILGTLFGVKVFVHEEVDPDKSLMFHPSACAYATQIGPRFQTDYQLDDLAERMSLDMLYGVKVLDGGKRQAVLGTII